MAEDGEPPAQTELTEAPPAPVPGEDDAQPEVPEAVPWWRDLGTGDLPNDLIAGALVAILLIPQAFAYATLANLPPAVGIAAAMVAPVAYSIFGGSRHLAVGPVALVSLLVGDAVGDVTGFEHGTALVIAALAGLVLVVIGGLRLGFVFRAFTPPVMTGFVFAAALVIATSQLGSLLLLDLPRGVPAVDLWQLVVRDIGDANVVVFGVGLAVLATLLGLPPVLRRMWGLHGAGDGDGDGDVGAAWQQHAVRAVPLVVLLVAAGLVRMLGLEGRGVATLGRVDLPSLLPVLPSLDAVPVADAIVAAVSVALVAAVTSLAVAQTLAARHGGEVGMSRELFSLGLANLGVSLTGGYAVGASLSRSAVVADSGGRSPLGTVFGAIILGLAAVFLKPVLAAIPVAALAALIMRAAIGMLDMASVREAWAHDRWVLVFMAVPFAAVLLFGVQVGLVATLATGAAHLSLQWFVPSRDFAG